MAGFGAETTTPSSHPSPFYKYQGSSKVVDCILRMNTRLDTIALVAADVNIDAARRALRVIGLASQMYLAIVDETEPGVRATV